MVTNPALLDALLRQARDAAPPTPAEIHAQRRAWVLAEAAFGSDADEAAYDAALVSGDQATLARLNAEAAARVRQAQAILDRAG